MHHAQKTAKEDGGFGNPRKDRGNPVEDAEEYVISL